MTQTTKGSCLCGQVRYEITGNMGIFQYCHCSRCRKTSGSAHSSNLFVKPEQFKWLQGEALVGYYTIPEARHFATCFCKNCGSALPWASKSGKAIIVPAGGLDDDPGIKPIQSIFCASGATWYRHVSELPMYDEMPLKK